MPASKNIIVDNKEIPLSKLYKEHFSEYLSISTFRRYVLEMKAPLTMSNIKDMCIYISKDRVNIDGASYTFREAWVTFKEDKSLCYETFLKKMRITEKRVFTEDEMRTLLISRKKTSRVNDTKIIDRDFTLWEDMYVLLRRKWA